MPVPQPQKQKTFFVSIQPKQKAEAVYERLNQRLNYGGLRKPFSRDIEVEFENILPGEQSKKKSFRLPDGQYIRDAVSIHEVLAVVISAVQNPDPFDCKVVVIEVPN